MKNYVLVASLFSLLACGSEIKTVDGTSTSGAGGAGAGGGASATVGVGGAPPNPCMPPDGPASPAPLCGPSAPCQILAEEILPVKPAFRNDAPALSLDTLCHPRILFSVAENGAYEGFDAIQKAPGDWSVFPTPFALATAGLSNGPEIPFAFPNDGAYGASLWAFSAEGWKKVEDVPAQVTHRAQGFSRIGDGKIAAAFVSDVSELILGTYDGKWTLSTLGDTSSPPPIAISPEGSPHVVTWSPVSGNWSLTWHAPPAAEEIALPLGEGGVLGSEVQRPALAVTMADAQNPQGKPHILALRSAPNNTLELVYVTREAENTWTVVPIEKTIAGTTLVPLAIVTGEAGEVRLFYSRYRPTLPGQGNILVAWPNGPDAVSKEILVSGTDAFGGTFERDGAGRIHIAMYTFAQPSQFDVRYWVVGP